MKRMQLQFARVLFHLLGVAAISTLSFLLTAGGLHSRILLASTSRTGFEFQWEKLAIQVGLAACVWAFGVITYHWVRVGIEKRKTAAIARPTGTAMTEFLIILVPYLLLTSGLAQLAVLNITSMLADVAIYDATRTVWIWAPELQMSRDGLATGSSRSGSGANAWGASNIEHRGRAVAAMMLAPTAPGDFMIAQTNPSAYALTDQRALVAGMFDMGMSETSYDSFWEKVNTGGGGAFAAGGSFGLKTRQAVGSDVTYWKAFDGESSFYQRAARKATFANYCMWEGGGSFNAAMGGATITVSFTYMYNYVFPWFGYIWGENATIAGRNGWYHPIRRRHSITALPDMR